MATLTFPIEAVRALVAHAQAATTHRAAYGGTAVAALQFVKDSGIYLMSSGLPIAPPVYAKGYDPTKDGDVWDRSVDAVGGDDFCETFPLDESLLRMVNNPRAVRFTVRCGARSLSIGVDLGPAPAVPKADRLFFVALDGVRIDPAVNPPAEGSVEDRRDLTPVQQRTAADMKPGYALSLGAGRCLVCVAKGPDAAAEAERMRKAAFAREARKAKRAPRRTAGARA